MTDPGNCEATVRYNMPTTNLPDANFSSTDALPSGSPFPMGKTVLTFDATDASGQTASCSFNVEVRDGESPQVQCPDNITVQARPGSETAVVDYTTPTARDNCGRASVSQSSGLADRRFHFEFMRAFDQLLTLLTIGNQISNRDDAQVVFFGELE